MQATRKQDAFVLVRAGVEEKTPRVSGIQLSQGAATGSLPVSAKEEEKKDDSSLKIILARSVKSSKGFRYETRLFIGGQVSVNSSAVKYIQFLGSSAVFPWTLINSTTEFGSLDALFDEFFIRRVTLRYVPRNKYSAQSTASASAAGSPGDVNTCAATVVYLPHLGPAYTDSSSAWINMHQAQHHKLVDLGSPWTFPMENIEKFAWDGPLMDQTSAASAMGWCQIGRYAEYGGFAQLATPLGSGASAGIGALLENGVFGDFIGEFDVAFRARA